VTSFIAADLLANQSMQQLTIRPCSHLEGKSNRCHPAVHLKHCASERTAKPGNSIKDPGKNKWIKTPEQQSRVRHVSQLLEPFAATIDLFGLIVDVEGHPHRRPAGPLEMERFGTVIA
jgi:hypothetical protein